MIIALCHSAVDDKCLMLNILSESIDECVVLCLLVFLAVSKPFTN